MNSTETPGGTGIPAGWYDNPSGDGLRWWDGERWTEHVHATARASAAGAPVEGEEPAGAGPDDDVADDDEAREGAPPRDLVKLRESIRAQGTKAVGMLLGAVVLVIVVIALLLSGGSDGNGPGGSGAGGPGVGNGGAPSSEVGD